MDALFRSLTQHSAEIALLLLLASVCLTVALVRISVRQRRHQSRWNILLQGSNGESLESLLHGHLRERVRLEGQIAALESRIGELEEAMRTSKRHLGLVRYDAFEDVGGSQSFALAVYDDEGNGAIVNSIIGRAECRVYCKPLVNGRSERDLSQEEQRAIREARADGPKSFVSR